MRIVANEHTNSSPNDCSTAPGVGRPLGSHVGAPSLRRVGEFTLLSLIDKGGMGVV